FEKALKLEPDNVKTLTSYAIALIELGKFEESCKFFEKSFKVRR
ncbi:MAG: O-linked GlcNAc transferase, partial [Okeania sp. SIO2H7]|nr:O-linked GlcNAc transferase [Okeania sp. SIO2H7]